MLLKTKTKAKTILIGLLVLTLLAACAKDPNRKPVVIKTPELGELAAYTDQVTITFKFLDITGTVEKSVCDFQWSDDNRMVGSCGNLAPGDYTYQLEFRKATDKELLVEANGTVNIGQDNTVVILPQLKIIEGPYEKFVAVPVEDIPPVANAGDDQVVEAGTEVTLDGSASISNADSATLSYLWTTPAGISLPDSTISQPTFTVSASTVGGTKLLFSLVVTDEAQLVSEVDTIEITVTEPIKTPPTSNAGTDQVIEAGALVMLDGSASISNSDSAALTYLWTAPAGISLSDSTIFQPTFTVPASTVGDTKLLFSLVVTDEDKLISEADLVEVIVVEPVNILTSANAGTDQMVDAGDLVVLDGSLSLSNSKLIYLWSRPAGINLSANDVAKPTFVMPSSLAIVGSEFSFMLKVTDEQGNSASDNVVITIRNFMPVASAGPDQNAEVGDVIALDASGSTDKNNDVLTYLWTPPSGVDLSDNNLKKPTFVFADGTKTGVYSFNLRVDDGHGGSNVDRVNINVLNTAPTVAAVAERNKIIGFDAVNFDGSASRDVNGDPLSYAWTILSAPVGSVAMLLKPISVESSFTPDKVGEYIFQLDVSDGLLNSVSTFQFVSRLVRDMVIIPGGTFEMGDVTGSGETDEIPVRSVSIAAFELGKYQVTFEEYDTYLTVIGREKGKANDDEVYDWGWGRNQRPVVEVSWNDIQAYLIWLNAELGLEESINKYRLPSEAEWEWAARGRQSIDDIYMAYPWGSSIDHNNANYGSEICCDGFSVADTLDLYLNSSPVGSFAANPFGLYDMHGNVWEWVEDCWHFGYKGAPIDGSAWVDSCEDSSRTLRGGAWNFSPTNLRSANRIRFAAGARNFNNGFRLARTL